jgi:membrane protease YdiL (CAAX protease family)
MSPQNDRFPSIPQAFLLLIALMAVEYLVGAVLYEFRQPLNLTSNEAGALTALLGSGVFFSVLMHLRQMTYGDLFHRSQASVGATLALLLPPIVMILPALVLVDTAIVEVVASVFPLSRAEQQMFERMAAPNIAAIVSACVLAPVLEEMLFRGLILRAFLLQYPKWMAIFASAAIFGIAHLNIYQFVVAFALGTVGGWLYERTRSLVPCIALHALYNTSLTVLDANADGSEVSAGTWACAFVAAAAGTLMLRRLLLGRGTRPVA